MSVIHDDEVQRLFRDMFTARRAVAQHQEDLRKAESAAQGAREGLENAQRALSDIESRIQRLAERAAGVDTTQDVIERPVRSEYVPIRR
jgi:hypothetical protein